MGLDEKWLGDKVNMGGLFDTYVNFHIGFDTVGAAFGRFKWTVDHSKHFTINDHSPGVKDTMTWRRGSN